MNAALLVMGLLPLIVYFGIDAWLGYRAGIIAAMVSTLAMVILSTSLLGELDRFMLGEALLILLMGCISLKMNNQKFFKFQPTVLGVVFAGIFAWFQVFDQPLILHSLPLIEKALEESAAAPTDEAPGAAAVATGSSIQASTLLMLRTEAFQKILTRLSGLMVGLLLAHALIMAYAALYLSTRQWVLWRAAIYPAMLVLVIVNNLFP